jgi:cobalt/nickel transport protein
MAPPRYLAALGLLLGVALAPALAHYHMLLPESPSGAREKAIAILFEFGHPFEHQLFDAQVPERVVIFSPDGEPTDVTKKLQPITVKGEGEKNVAAFQFSFTPPKRGDYTLVAVTAPVWMEEEKLFLKDTVKVIYHVQTQNGWDAATGKSFEIVPLTRPYGLQPGMVFQAQALASGKPLAAAMVEVERFNPQPPKNLPPDEQITRRVKADPNGVFTCSLMEAGWWCVAVERDGGQRERDGKMYPVHERAIFWVFVDEAPKP